MPATLEELTRFQDFAAKRLASDESDLSMQQLLDLWRIDNPDAEELQESVSSIKEALEDWDRGDRGLDHIRELKSMEEIYVRQTVEQGLRDGEASRTLTTDELRARLGLPS